MRTLLASSIEAWCFVVELGIADEEEDVVDEEEEEDDGGGVISALVGLTLRVLLVSRRQFARPAVVFSVLLQTILTPPVLAVSAPIRPCATTLSSSAKNATAISFFLASQSLRASISALLRFVGLCCLLGDLLLGDAGVGLEDLSREMTSLRGETGGLRGECWSFQPLM